MAGVEQRGEESEMRCRQWGWMGETDAPGSAIHWKCTLLDYQQPSTMQPYFVRAVGLLSSDGKGSKDDISLPTF